MDTIFRNHTAPSQLLKLPNVGSAYYGPSFERMGYRVFYFGTGAALLIDAGILVKTWKCSRRLTYQDCSYQISRATTLHYSRRLFVASPVNLNSFNLFIRPSLPTAVQCERKPVAVATASRISPPSAPTAKPKKSRRRRGISRTQSFKPESLPSPDVGPKRVRGATKRVRAVTSGGESADLKRSSYSSLGISEAQSLGPQLPSSSGAQSLPSPDVGQKRVRGATKRMRAVSSGGESDDWQPISYGPPGSSAAKSLGPQLSPSSGAQSLPSPDVGQKRVRGATKRMRAVSSGGESADLKRSSCSSLGSSEAQSLGPPLPPSSGTQSLPSSDVGQKGVRGASKRIRAFSSGGESADLKRSSCGPLESSEAQSLGSQWPPSKEAGDESPPWISASSFLENTSQFPPAQGLGPEMVGVLPLPTLAPHQSPGVSAPGQEHSPSPPTSLPAQSPGSQLSPSGVLTAQMVNDVPTSTVLPHQSCSGASLVQRPSHDPQIEVTRGSVPTQSPGSQSPPSQNSGGQIVNVFFTPPGLQHSGSVGARYSGDNDSPPAMPAAGPSPPAPPRSESLQPRMQADAPTDVSADVVSREVQHFQVAPMNLPLYTSLSNFVCEFSVRVLILSFKWASTVPAFKRLVRDDQLALLQHCWSNIFLFGLLQNASGIPLSSFLMSAATHLEHRQGDSWPLFGRSATDQVSAIQDFFSTLENLHVDHVEYAYLRAIMIFNPGTLSFVVFRAVYMYWLYLVSHSL